MADAPAWVEMGPQKLSGMYFVPHPPPLPVWVDGDPAPGGSDGLMRVVATTGPDQGAPLRRAYVDLIDRGRRKVFLASFLFADAEVAEALARAAERLRGGVYVLTALNRGFRIDLGDAEARDAQSDAARRDQHFTNLNRLANSGVWLRSASNLHAKLCVVDDREALVTSANVTREAFDDNPENGLHLRSPALARELGRTFARVFLHHAREESPPAAKLNVGGLPASRGARWLPFRQQETDRIVATVAAEEASIVGAILEMVKGAEREIVLTAWSAVGLKDHPVGAALRDRVARGVKLLAVLPPDNRAADRRSTGEWLFGRGKTGEVIVRGLNRTHAKAIVVDRARALLWTGNLDGHHGFADGFEVGVVTSRSEVVQTLRAYIVELANRAQYAGVFAPTLGDLAAAYAKSSGLAGDWRIVLPADSRLGPAELTQALRSSAVSFVQRGAQMVLGVDDTAEMVGQLDPRARRLTIERVSVGPNLVSRPEGYVAGCRFSVSQEGERGAKQRRRRK
jgi:phosphatidylserine/phosphatidylglycerophosphate/cardiolipin synthase-like enzyme